jgi:deazaflavin-dependent oxidoreductase (nitroreductase family)
MGHCGAVIDDRLYSRFSMGISAGVLRALGKLNVNEPAWSHNLKANPDAEIEIRGGRTPVRARVAQAEEREDLWRRMNRSYAGFDDYARRTSRDIAVFGLEPR